MSLKKEILSIEDLRVVFKNPFKNVAAVKDVDLKIYEGEKLALIGESGSGKSILALSVLRLLPKNAESSGKIIFKGKNLLELNESEMREIRGKQIALIPQNQASLNPVLTVGFQASEPIFHHFKVNKKVAFDKILKLFKFFKIPEKRALDYPHQFSGGMRQRVLVSMGLSTNPDLILADEPTKGLDFTKKNKIIEIFNKINKTSLIITHDLHFAQKISDRIAVMYRGEIVEISSSKDFFCSPLHPYSKGLLNSLPSRGLKPIKEGRRKYIKGCIFRDRCDFSYKRCRIKPPLLNVNSSFVRCWLYD